MEYNILSQSLRLFANSYYSAIKICDYNQTINVSQLIELQEYKLLKLINHARENVDYYKDILENLVIESTNDLEKIPFLSKKLIKENFLKLQAKNIRKERFLKDSTSGSTGENTSFYTDKKLNSIRHACAHRGDSWTGWQLGEPSVYLWGATKDTDKAKKIIKKITNSRIFFNNTILSSYYMTNSDMEKYVNIINKKRPSLIVGYPSSLELFTNFIKNKGLSIWSPKGIVTGGETLYSSQRELIENVFNAKVLNRYGCREVGLIANECNLQNGLHICSDHVIVEVINENGELCKPGEIGEIVVTDLDNYVFPLIRYKIGDIGKTALEACTCGKPFPLLESIEGRTFDLLVGINGNRVLGTFFTTYLRYEVLGIVKFQIIQNEIEIVNIAIVANELFDKKEERKIIVAFKEKLGASTRVIVEQVEELNPTQSGKYRWIISNISPFNSTE